MAKEWRWTPYLAIKSSFAPTLLSLQNTISFSFQPKMDTIFAISWWRQVAVECYFTLVNEQPRTYFENSAIVDYVKIMSRDVEVLILFKVRCRAIRKRLCTTYYIAYVYYNLCKWLELQLDLCCENFFLYFALNSSFQILTSFFVEYTLCCAMNLFVSICVTR